VADILLAVFPVFLIAVIGYAMKKGLGISTLGLANLSIYLTGPALTIYALSLRKLDASMLMTGLASFALFIALIILAEILARLFRLEKGKHLVLDMCSFMMNTGYIGMPVALLAFGTEAFVHAAVFQTVGAFLMFSYGISRISGKTGGIPEFLKIPQIYAAVFAVAVALMGIALPSPIMFSVEWLGKGDILLSLLIIGCRFAIMDLRKVWDGFVLSVSAFKLFFVPALALLVAAFFGLSGDAFRGFMIQSATPVAISTVVFSTKYNNPEVDTFASIVAVTTIASMLTLALLILFL
jgi:predicted permease